MNFFKALKYRHAGDRKKRSRIMTVAFIFLVLGILCLAGAVISRMTIEKNYKSEVPQGSITKPFTAYLSVHVLNIPLTIIPSPDDDIHIDYVSDSDIIIFEEDGRLYIEQDAGFVISILNSQRFDYGITLSLPERSYMNILIETNSANVKSCPLSTYIMKLRSKSGRMDIEEICSSGAVTASLESGGGDIKLSGEGDADFSIGTGTVQLTLLSKKNISVRQDSFVYIDGLSSDGVEYENVKSRLSLSALGGKFRVKTADGA